MDAIEVMNTALDHLKVGWLTGPDDATEKGVRTRRQFALCRDAVLEAHPWNWAMVRMRLSRSTRVPACDWAYQYPLPTVPYCLKVRDPKPDQIPWEVGTDVIDGRVLLSNHETLSIRYTARMENMNAWGPLAVVALSYLLASHLAPPFTGDVNKAKYWATVYLQGLGEAISSDSREGSPVVVPAPTLLTSIR